MSGPSVYVAIGTDCVSMAAGERVSVWRPQPGGAAVTVLSAPAGRHARTGDNGRVPGQCE